MATQVVFNNKMLTTICRSILLAALLSPLTVIADSGKKTRVRFDQTPAKNVLVEKSRRLLTLVLADGRKKSFPIALGGEPVGHKWRRGDSRTPEGTYFVDWKNTDSDYYLSMRISYPNQEDRRIAERLGVNPGGQIMIHGYPNDARPPYKKYKNSDWTDGCIAVSNFAMQEIWLAVREDTPITIKP